MSNNRKKTGGNLSPRAQALYMRRVEQLEQLQSGEITEVPAWLQKVAEKDAEHTTDVLENGVVHPGSVSFDDLDDIALAAHGFDGKVSADDLRERFGISKKVSLGVDFDLASYMRRARGKGRGKAKGGKGKGGGKKLPNPSDVDTVVTSYLKGVPDVGMQGNLVIAEFNAEFLDAHKANTFLSTYVKLVKKSHVLFVEECDFSGLQVIGQAAGYGYRASKANTRNQAVGFLVHPRFDIVQVKVCDAVGSVKGVPDLRPAYQLDLKDRTSGETFSVVVVHLKSMRGGPATTGPIRYQQCKVLANWLGSSFSGIVAGDFNCFLNNTQDTDPLVNAGFKLVYPNDTTSTQSMGGRLDGFFHMGLSHKLGAYQVRSIWKNKVFGRGFSDHSWIKTTMRLCGVTGANDSTCNVEDSKTGPYSDNPSDPAEVTPEE